MKKFNLRWIFPVFFVWIACQPTAIRPTEKLKVVDADIYPHLISYAPSHTSELKSKYQQFLDQCECKYDVVEIDSLISAIKYLQYGVPVYWLFPENKEIRKKYSLQEIENGVNIFLDKFGHLFNVTSSELLLVSEESSEDYVDFQYTKQFPADYPFVNGEFNHFRFIVSWYGEVGYVMSTALPTRPMKNIAWIDPEVGRRSLIQHTIPYQVNNRNAVFVIQSVQMVGGGKQTAIVIVRRKPSSFDLMLRPDNIELQYHYAWAYEITPVGQNVPLFRVYVDAESGEILESFYLSD